MPQRAMRASTCAWPGGGGGSATSRRAVLPPHNLDQGAVQGIWVMSQSLQPAYGPADSVPLL